MISFAIKGTQIEITDAIREYVDKRFSGLEKYLKNQEHDDVIFVELGKTTLHHKHGEHFRAEVRFRTKKKNIYAVSEKDNLYSAIDDVKTEVVRELTSNMGRTRALFKRGSQKIKEIMKAPFGRKEKE